MSNEETLAVIETALQNFAHGRRVFALKQLEALLGWQAPWASESMAYIERGIERLTVKNG